jgi:hypothetical protein
MKLDSIDFRGGDAKKVSDAAMHGVNTSIAFISADLSGDSLSLGFDYSAIYAPDQSYIRISGKAVFTGKESKRAYDEWMKTKKIGGEAGEYIVNAIHYNASLNAVMIAKVFNMAPPITLPRLTFEAAGKPAERKK